MKSEQPQPESQSPRRRRRFLKTRAGLVVVGVVLAILLLEIGLRVAGWVFYRGHERATAPEACKGKTTVLCLGDSNTFGLHLKAEEAYPAQLQALFNAERSQEPFCVVNLGVPALNSSHVRRRFGSYLSEYQPKVVLVMAGVNNPLNRVDRTGSISRLRAILLHCYTYKLVNILLYNAGIIAQNTEATKQAAEFDLAAIAEEASTRGVKLVLLAYPPGFEPFTAINCAAKHVAAERSLPFVPCDAVFQNLVGPLGYRALFLPDNHPTATGCSIIARLVARELVKQGVAPAIPEMGEWDCAHLDKEAREALRDRLATFPPAAASPAGEMVYRFCDHFADAERRSDDESHIDKVSYLEFHGDYVPALYAHANSCITFRGIRVPEHGRLRFSIGLDKRVWDKIGDGAEFFVDVRGDAPTRTFRRYLDPKKNAADRGWFAQDLAIAPARKAEIVFRTHCGPERDNAFDWAYFVDPRLVVARPDEREAVAGRKEQ